MSIRKWNIITKIKEEKDFLIPIGLVIVAIVIFYIGDPESFNKILSPKDKKVTWFEMVAVLLVGVAAGFFRVIIIRGISRRYDHKIEVIESKAEKEPEKVRYAWDIARTKMEQYFDRNLIQVKSIYWLSVFIMLVGFGFIIFGITRTINSPSEIKLSYLSGIAGIISEFIGLTFMFLYKSTMEQAATYMNILERMNSVGMSVQILDSISEDDKDLKNITKSELVKLLLKQTP